MSWSTIATPVSPGPRRSGTAWTCEHARHRGRQAQLSPYRRPLGRRLRPRRARLAKRVVEIGVADHLEERLPLQPARAQVEHGAGALVHQEDVVVAVHRDHALHHAVEDGGGLGLLLGEVLDLLAQPGREHVEGASERADLVRRAHGRAHREVALAELAGDGLHLDHRARHPSRHEEADAERHRERHHARPPASRGGRSRARRSPRRAARPAAARRRSGRRPGGQRHVEEGRLQRRAAAEIASDPSLERRAHLGPRRDGSPSPATPAGASPDSATTRPSGRIKVTRAPVARAARWAKAWRAASPASPRRRPRASSWSTRSTATRRASSDSTAKASSAWFR